ncbi:MAG: type II/IV secretion system protein [Planctomycetes bacterium]|nr:type II/IV secretion system protein [Planctomycetota bacterium]
MSVKRLVRKSRLFATVVIAVLALPAGAWAADGPFPRGEGFYFDIFTVILFLAIYAAWIKTSSWVDRDAQELSLPGDMWNGLMLAGGALSLIMIWIMPVFWLSFFVFVLLLAAPSLYYVSVRNRKVKAPERVLTPDHLRSLARRYLKLDFGKASDDTARDGVPVRFFGRRSEGQPDDPNRVARVMESVGYKTAQEMVYDACNRRATDIHLEPTKSEMTVRFRIDGMLTPADPFSRATGDAVISIFKVLCNMDITEKRKPQDGSMSAQVEDHVVDFRVATSGSVSGEKLVMRILDTSQQIISLEQLGMREKMHTQLRSIVTQPHGLFIVCGPTGAGKSTTLYACLNEIDRYQQNIITIENPVEYQLENVTQIEVNPKAGKTFATELRSILRQDPDVIMIGEIRDKETAEIACQAAQTGHMVFTTLHANDAVTALGRLIDLGVQPFMIASALSGVLGQRLVRLLCPKCKVRYKPNPELLRKANLPVEKIKFFYKPPEQNDGEESEEEVCENCGGSGYQKRTGVFELFVITEKIRDMIRDNPNMTAIKQEAVKSGMRYLYEDGLRQVIEGKTSIQELLRVCK